MTRLLRFAAILTLLALTLWPTLAEFEHHGDGAAAHETQCTGDCGCPCHSRTMAVADAEGLLIPAPVSITTPTEPALPPAGDPAAVDHPPKQFS